MSIDIEKSDYEARCFVCGMVRDKNDAWQINTGHWSSRFERHPWVQLADVEAWARELRSVVIGEVARRKRASQPFDSIEDLMPDKAWVEYTQMQARRYKEGAESRNRLAAEYGSLDRALATINRQPKEPNGPARTLGDALRHMGLEPEEYAHLINRPVKEIDVMRPLPDVSRTAFQKRHKEKLERIKAAQAQADRIMGEHE